MKFNLSSVIKATAIMVVAFIALPIMLDAMPAPVKPVMMRQSDGSYRQVLLHGDEHCNAVTTTDGLTRLEADASGMLRAAGAFDPVVFNTTFKTRRSNVQARIKSTNNFPAHGSQRALAILVEYPETNLHPEGRRFSTPDARDLFDDLLNADDYDHDGATGSVHKYFYDSSCGVFDIKFDVYGPVTLKEDLSYYNALVNGENLNVWRLVVEACQAIDDEVDFHDYDRDGDGIIDNVYIFYAGAGAATGGNPADCIWQHAADVETISGAQYLFDGLRLNHYACSNEYRDVATETGEIVRQTEGIGTVCHEFSHVLGLPDLYDVTGGGHTTPGVWTVMDQGCHLNESRTPPYFSVLDRMMLEWIEPETIGDVPRTLSLRDISNNQAYRIPTANEHEYFLLENRQLIGWDSELPGHGLIVWHINYLADYWDRNQVNTGQGTSQAIIIPADGSNGPFSYAGDPYPGTSRVTSLTDEGYPNMLSINGDRTNAPISGITEAAGIINFDVCRAILSLDKVDGLTISDLTPSGFTAHWNPLPMSPGYMFNLYTLNADGSKNHVGAYSDLSVSGNSVAVSGLSPETEYCFTVRGVAGVIVGEDSDPCMVSTPAMSFRFSAPVALEASDLAGNSFTANWQPLEDAVDYSLTVATLTTGPDRDANVDFTGGIEALPDGWFTTCIATMSMNGYYGAESPSLSMGADYARLQSPLLPADVTTLEFWYRERTPSGRSSIVVGVLADGQWVDIDSVALGSVSEAAVHRVDQSLIPDGACAVRLVYRRVDKGTLAVDDVKVSYMGTSESTPLPEWNNRKLGSNIVQVRVDGLDPETDYYYTVCGIDGNGELSMSSKAVKATTLASTGVDNEYETHVKVTVTSDGTVNVEGCIDFDIYDMYGRKVQHCLPNHGVYIVKTNAKTIKLIY